jgi:hypothetical protein
MALAFVRPGAAIAALVVLPAASLVFAIVRAGRASESSEEDLRPKP